MIVDQIEPTLGEVVIIQYDGEYSDDSDAKTFHGNASALLDNDCKYEGEFQNGMFHGKGTFFWPSGIKFEGDFERGNIIGKGQYEWSDGSTYLGDVLNGLRHGSGKFIGSSGQTYEGEWTDGKRHGKGKVWYNEDRTSSFTGDWVKNLRHGYGTMKYASGNSYEGEWRDDKKCGSGLMIWRDVDEVYTGEWEDDLPHGLGEHIWGDSGSHTVRKEVCNIYRGNFAQGKRHGQGSFFFMNGSQYSGEWMNDAKQGEGLFFYTDGRIFGGMFQSNRMVTDFSKEETSAPRATEAVNPQFRLNIMDIYDCYPTLLYPTPTTRSLSTAVVNISSVSVRQSPGANREEAKAGEVREMERLLLKYNHYLRSALRKHTDLANKRRLRHALQQHQLLAAWAPTSVPSRAFKACATARILPKRLFCMDLGQMLRFLRECGIIGPFFRSYDLSQCLQQMRDEAKLACIGKLREYRQQMWEAEQRRQRAHTLTSLNNDPSPTQSDLGGSSLEVAQLSWEESPEETARYLNMRVPTIVDAYLQSGSWDPAFLSLASQPLLEREFTELFVRAVAVHYARAKPIGAHYSAEMAAVAGMSLSQILYYVLAQKLLPVVSDPDQHIPAFYREFYFEEVQSQLYSIDSLAASTTVVAVAAAAPPSPTVRSPKGGAATGGVTFVEPAKNGADSAGTLSLTFFEQLWAHLRALADEKAKACRSTHSSVSSVSDTLLSAMHSAGPPALSVNPTGGSVRLKQLVQFLLSLRGNVIVAYATEFSLLMAMECAPPHPMSRSPAPAPLFGADVVMSEPPPPTSQDGAVSSEDKLTTESENEARMAASKTAFATLKPGDFDLSCVENRIDFEDFLELLCKVIAGPLWVHTAPAAELPEPVQSEVADVTAAPAATNTTAPPAGVSIEGGVTAAAAVSAKGDQDSVSVYSVSLADVLAERLSAWKQSFDLAALTRVPSVGTVIQEAQQ